MFRRTYRALFLMLTLFAALSVTSLVSAQSAPLTHVVSTADGMISMHLPDGWLEQDASAPYFSSVMAVGDSSTTLQQAVKSLTSPNPAQITGRAGFVVIVDPAILSGNTPEAAASDMFNTIASSVQQTSGQILDQGTVTIGGQYPGSYMIATVPQSDAVGLTGVFVAGSSVVQFSLGASPADTFDTNQQLFTDMMNSIRIPSEQGSSAAPTPAPAQPVPSTTSGGAVVSPNQIFSVELPAGWSIEFSNTVPNFNDVLVFGSSDSAMQTNYDVLIVGNALTPFTGIGGMVGVINPNLFAGTPLTMVVAPLLTQLVQLATAAGATAVGDPQAHTFGGGYEGQIQELDDGFVSVMHTDDQLLVGVVLTDDLNANRDQMMGILDSIRIPPEAANVEQSPVTLVPPLATAAAPMTVRSTDDQVSLIIPSDWTMLDHIADGAILAYGDSEDAAMSRLYSVKPDLASAVVITGSGGVVVLYPMAQFGIDPSNPDLMPLIQRALGNLQGYSVAQPPQPLPGIDHAVYAIISGTESGYLALIPFGDQIAYVTATAATADDFAAMQDDLLNMVMSVQVPAAAEATPAPGLGGLGGLEIRTTPEITPTAAPSGLGGLGSLSPVTTPESTPDS